MLGLADGTEQDMIVKSAQKDPSIASGALLAFFHLRHLDIRRVKLTCLSHLNYLYSAQRSAYQIKKVFDKLKSSKMDDIQSDFDYYNKIERHGSVVMSVTNAMGHTTTYTAAIEAYRKLESLALLLGSNYSLKDNYIVDHVQLLHDIWTGIGDILSAKAVQCEFILEALYNATQRMQIDQLDRRITLLLNFDFTHDVSSSHCLVHFQRHAVLIRRQNDLLTKLRSAAIHEFRNQGLPFVDQSDVSDRTLGPQVFLVSTFSPCKEKLHLCEVNSFFADFFQIIDEVENISNIQSDGVQLSLTPIRHVNKMIEICDNVSEYFVAQLDDKMTYSSQIQKDFLNLTIMPSELLEETARFSLVDMINLYHVTRCYFMLKNSLIKTDIANGIYCGIADTLGFSRSHLYLRLVQPSLSSDPSSRQEVTSRPHRPVPSDDRAVDRYRPASYCLAVQDYDELVPKTISFKDVSSVADIAQSPRKIEKLVIISKVQILHRELMVAALRCSSIMATWPCDNSVPGDESSASKLTGGDTATVATSMVPGDVKMQHYFAEMFVSLQWERQWPRAKYLEYFEASIGGSNMDKIRVDALWRMCTEMEFVIDELALRATIAEQTSRILWILNSQWEGDFHSSHFEVGQSLRINPDQKDVLASGTFKNLFFLPHFTAIMSAGRRLSHDQLRNGLELWATSITSLADVIYVFVANARLGEFGSGERGSWGGPEGIHQQVLELRREMSKTDEITIGRLLTLSRQQALLEIEMSMIQLKQRKRVQNN